MKDFTTWNNGPDYSVGKGTHSEYIYTSTQEVLWHYSSYSHSSIDNADYYSIVKAEHRYVYRELKIYVRCEALSHAWQIWSDCDLSKRPKRQMIAYCISALPVTADANAGIKGIINYL